MPDLWNEIAPTRATRKALADCCAAIAALENGDLPGIEAALMPYGAGAARALNWGPAYNQRHALWFAGDTVVVLLHGIDFEADLPFVVLNSDQLDCTNGAGRLMRYTSVMLADGAAVIDAAILSAQTVLGVPVVRLAVVGHSHGGALAFAWFTQRASALPVPEANIRVVTLGAPRVFDDRAARSIRADVLRINAVDDFVGYVPPTTWWKPWPTPLNVVAGRQEYLHVGAGTVMTDIGETRTLGNDNPGSDASLVEYLIGLVSVPWTIEAHRVTTYRDRLLRVTGTIPAFPLATDNFFEGSIMADTYKTTYFFDQGGYGWSESFYQEASTSEAALANASDLNYLTARRRLLGVTTDGSDIQPRLLAVRVSNINTAFRDVAVATFDPSASSLATGFTADIPNTTLLLRFTMSLGGFFYHRAQFLRGVPDLVIGKGGVYVANPSFQLAFNGWFGELQRRNFGAFLPLASNQFRDNVAIAQVGADVVITTKTAINWAAGDRVTITRVKPHSLFLVNGKLSHGPFEVASTNGNFEFSVARTTLLSTPTKFGRSRKLVYGFVPFNQSVSVVRATHRITGRPFVVPRGRRRVLA